MNKRVLVLPLIFFFIIIMVFFYLLIKDRDPSKIPSVLIDKNIPVFKTKTLFNNKTFISSEEFGNKITLVNFFASWCKGCKEEHDFLKKFSNEVGIKIIGINYKDKKKNAINWIKKMGNPYSDILIDKNGKIAIEWGVYGIPETFVVNSNKIIKYRHVGPITKDTYKKINLIIKENK